MAKKYWLVKSEPEVFSIIDLKKSENRTTCWDGVRNYQARNFIRDEMKRGDLVLFYYSNADPNAAAGYCEVVKEGYPDHSQFDKENKHFFPAADPENPVWYMLDLRLVKEFSTLVTLDQIKKNPRLQDMQLLKRGNRLSVMPVSKSEFEEIVKMGS